MKVFLAMPYTQLCDKKTNILFPKYQEFFEKLISKLEDIGCEYFLAHKRENWGKNYSSDVESTKIDFETIKSSDLVCIIPGVPHSGGVHVEIGWASANNRKLKIFLKENYPYSPMVTGIKCLTNTEFFYYEDDFSDKLLNMIIKCVTDEMEKEKCTK